MGRWSGLGNLLVSKMGIAAKAVVSKANKVTFMVIDKAVRVG